MLYARVRGRSWLLLLFFPLSLLREVTSQEDIKLQTLEKNCSPATASRSCSSACSCTKESLSFLARIPCIPFLHLERIAATATHRVSAIIIHQWFHRDSIWRILNTIITPFSGPKNFVLQLTSIVKRVLLKATNSYKQL